MIDQIIGYGKTIKTVLIVGYGSMGRRRIRLIRVLLPAANIICVDSDSGRAAQAKKDGCEVAGSLEEGIGMGPDVAFVCTSPGSHKKIILQLLNASVSVFTELNLIADGYDEMKRTAEEKKATLFISSTLMYKRQMRFFKETVSLQTKPLAYIYHVGQYLPDWHPWESYKDFFVGRKETNGVREILAIQLPWIINTFGRIKDVKCVKQNCTDLDIDFPDSVIMTVEHENGNIGCFTADVVSRKASTELEIIGEDLHVVWNGHNDDLMKMDPDTGEVKPIVLYDTQEHQEGYSDIITEEPYLDEIREFFDVLGGKDPVYGIEDDAYVLKVIDRIEGSDDTESSFDLDSFINRYVTRRASSMFEQDIRSHREELFEKIRNRSILVIGGAGSIGSSFIRAVLQFEPARLVVVDTNENGLTELTRFLRSSGEYESLIPDEYLTYPMDYASVTFRRMFLNSKRSNGRVGFDIVANFSAHKHVRSEKDIYSIEALLRNNVINAKKLLDLLQDNPPESYFCVSTDKAANPVNVMGASKRIMEDLIFSYSDLFPVKTARFANVAFSNGSLPDGFLRRIRLHQPLSGPSDVKRYFVSPEESGQICMLATILGKTRDILFPKLDSLQMTSFDRIAEDLLSDMGYDIDRCNSAEEARKKMEQWERGKPYPVYFDVSDTSGEKAYEEFYVEGESVDLESFESLGVVYDKPVPNRERLGRLIKDLEETFEAEGHTKEDIVGLMASYLPNFRHIETGSGLDGKM